MCTALLTSHVMCLWVNTHKTRYTRVPPGTQLRSALEGTAAAISSAQDQMPKVRSKSHPGAEVT